MICDPDYRPLKRKEIAYLLGVPQEERQVLWQILRELCEEGSIERTAKGKYRKSQSVTGIFTANARGFGFVSVEGAEDDLFIPPDAVNGACHKDKVLVRVERGSGLDGKRPEGVIVCILERGVTELIGTFRKNKSFGFVIPDDRHYGKDIFIPKKYIAAAKDGDKVVVHILSFGNDEESPTGEVAEVLGAADDASMDVTCIARAYGIEEEFPEAVLREVCGIPKTVAYDGGRKDLRDRLTVTIDGEDARDLDDAITLERCGDGFALGVHIADVSHYVREGSALDEEALKRATSVYLCDRVVPMLPKELSNGICSLNAGEDRLALSCLVTFDKKGNVLNHEIAETIIRVDERLSYTGVKTILAGEEHPEGQREDIRALCALMREAAAILKEKRRKRGAIDFDFPEAKIIVDAQGNPTDIYPYERNVATDIIEDFMLLANETVAEDYFWQELPFLYRTHETPDADRIKKLDTFIRNFGYYMKTGRESFHPKEIQKLLFSLEGEPEEALISRLALRSMKQAKYTTLNLGHFGLSTSYYTHFTSPIRRYPDLQIHRIIKENIHGKLNEKRCEHYEKILPAVAEQSSAMERRAQEAERELYKLKKVEYMERYVGESFTGVISGVTSWGFFVELPNTVEGLVSVNNLIDDYYLFDEARYQLVGEEFGRVFALGQEVEVRVLAASRQQRTIDFIPVEDAEDIFGFPDFVKKEEPDVYIIGEDEEVPEEIDLPDKDGILLNDWISDAESESLLAHYAKKRIEDI